MPSDRDRVAEERYVDEAAAGQDRDGDDDDLFGIDLGPAGDRRETESDDDIATAPVRPATKTLTERLATAAADRESAEPSDAQEPPAR